MMTTLIEIKEIFLHGKKYVEKIDFNEGKVKKSITQFNEDARDKMYSPPIFEFNEIAVFLDNKKAYPLLEIMFTAHKCQNGKNLRIGLVNNKGKYVQNFLVSKGENIVDITLPKKFRESKINEYLLLEKALKSKASHCTEQYSNRMPLKYKIIQLISKPKNHRYNMTTLENKKAG